VTLRTESGSTAAETEAGVPRHLQIIEERAAQPYAAVVGDLERIACSSCQRFEAVRSWVLCLIITCPPVHGVQVKDRRPKSRHGTVWKWSGFGARRNADRLPARHHI